MYYSLTSTAFRMAREAMVLHLYGMEQDNETIPDPSDPSKLQLDLAEVLALIEVRQTFKILVTVWPLSEGTRITFLTSSKKRPLGEILRVRCCEFFINKEHKAS